MILLFYKACNIISQTPNGRFTLVVPHQPSCCFSNRPGILDFGCFTFAVSSHQRIFPPDNHMTHSFLPSGLCSNVNLPILLIHPAIYFSATKLKLQLAHHPPPGCSTAPPPCFAFFPFLFRPLISYKISNELVMSFLVFDDFYSFEEYFAQCSLNFNQFSIYLKVKLGLWVLLSKITEVNCHFQHPMSSAHSIRITSLA